MNSADYRVTSLLTEHLGFAPLTLIDEIINDVNRIMYKCTDALEQFLMKRRESQLQQLAAAKNADDDVRLDAGTQKEQAKVFSEDEIRLGAAELETLLVSHVDKNFDKFELYTLRNIFTIPRDLVEGGWIRLKHQEGVTGEFLLAQSSADLDAHLQPLVDSINFELQLRKLLLLQKNKAAKILDLLRHYKHCVETITQAGPHLKLLPETIATLKHHLHPMNENVYYLLGQVDDLLKQVLRLNDKFMKDESLNGLRNIHFGPSARDNYIREKSLKILDEIGVLGTDAKHLSAKVLYSAYAQTE